jgi:hypothetical protein
LDDEVHHFSMWDDLQTQIEFRFHLNSYSYLRSRIVFLSVQKYISFPVSVSLSDNNSVSDENNSIIFFITLIMMIISIVFLVVVVFSLKFFHWSWFIFSFSLKVLQLLLCNLLRNQASSYYLLFIMKIWFFQIQLSEFWRETINFFFFK